MNNDELQTAVAMILGCAIRECGFVDVDDCRQFLKLTGTPDDELDHKAEQLYQISRKWAH